MLVVSKGRADTYRFKRKLSRLGLVYTEGSWKTENDALERKLARFCKKHGLTLKIILPEYERSSNYRYRFLKENLGDKGDGSIYHCAYCGRKLTKDTLRVDHIISVASVQKTKKGRRSLAKYGLKDVNDLDNLTASCQRCNDLKSEKGGLWIIRGRVGRDKYFWATIKLLIILAAIVFVYTGVETGGLKLLLNGIKSLWDVVVNNHNNISSLWE